jgi:hypothetical protein
VLSSTIHYEGNLLRPPPTQKFTAYGKKTIHEADPGEKSGRQPYINENWREKYSLCQPLEFLEENHKKK